MNSACFGRLSFISQINFVSLFDVGKAYSMPHTCRYSMPHTCRYSMPHTCSWKDREVEKFVVFRLPRLTL